MTKSGRFNYIKKGIVGVCAATMLTGLCAGSAFAAIPGVTNPATATDIVSGTADAATTAVNAQAQEVQISATVPTTVVAAVTSAGVLTFPDSKAFAITATNTSWPIKVSDLNVEVAANYSLKATEAEVAAAKDFYLAIDSTALNADANSNNDAAITNLKQTAVGNTPIGITMTGKLYSPSYSDVANGVQLATLKWTLSAY